MATKLSNNATTRLAASISSTATQISVTAGDGAKFPTLAAGDSFPVTLVKSDGQLEIVKCTARSGDLLTVVRAQEGTAAKAFTAGDRAELRVTEATLDAYTNERAEKAVQDGIATDGEATARTSKTKTLSPYGLGLNIATVKYETAAGMLLTSDKAYGLGMHGLGTVSNYIGDYPTGYYSIASTALNGPPGVGGYQAAAHYTRINADRGVWLVTASGNTNATRKTFVGVLHGTAIAWKELFTTDNFDPASKAEKVHSHSTGDVTGLQAALDGKAPTSHTHAIGDVAGLPAALDNKVNVAGDNRLFGTLQTSGMFKAAIAGIGEYVEVRNDSVQFGNAYNRFRFLKENADLALHQYNWDGSYLGRVLLVGGNRGVAFDIRPAAAGRNIALNGDQVNHEGDPFVITLYGSGTFYAPDYHAVVGVQTDSGNNVRYIITRRLFVR